MKNIYRVGETFNSDWTVTAGIWTWKIIKQNTRDRISMLFCEDSDVDYVINICKNNPQEGAKIIYSILNANNVTSYPN